MHLSFTYLIIILFITIGFSSFSSNLSIDGEVSFKTQKNIRISNITVTNNTNEATSNIAGDSINIIFDTNSGIPTSVTVTGVSGNYISPQLGITDVTDDITITGTFENASDQYVYVLNIGEYVLHGNPISNSITIYNSLAEVMVATNKPYYFKHHLENDIVVESYLEFVITPEMVLAYPEMTAGTYTLRGGINEEELENKPVLDNNLNELKRAYGENTWYCTYSGSNVLGCNPPDAPGLLVEMYTNGSVGVYSELYCGIDSDGDSSCS